MVNTSAGNSSESSITFAQSDGWCFEFLMLKSLLHSLDAQIVRTDLRICSQMREVPWESTISLFIPHFIEAHVGQINEKSDTLIP